VLIGGDKIEKEAAASGYLVLALDAEGRPLGDSHGGPRSGG
jgi:hypothetical protein